VLVVLVALASDCGERMLNCATRSLTKRDELNAARTGDVDTTGVLGGSLSRIFWTTGLSRCEAIVQRER
jgi:hypothetical protein